MGARYGANRKSDADNLTESLVAGLKQEAEQPNRDDERFNSQAAALGDDDKFDDDDEPTANAAKKHPDDDRVTLTPAEIDAAAKEMIEELYREYAKALKEQGLLEETK